MQSSKRPFSLLSSPSPLTQVSSISGYFSDSFFISSISHAANVSALALATKHTLFLPVLSAAALSEFAALSPAADEAVPDELHATSDTAIKVAKAILPNFLNFISFFLLY